MNNILVIDTSCDSLTIALKVGETLYTHKNMTERQGHSVALLPAIKELLDRARITVNDVDFFGAVVGPGSFTGIRVGVATMNAFAYANGKKVLAITAFESFAYDNQDEIFAIDAKHGNYYLAKRENGALVYNTQEGGELPNGAKILCVTDVTPESLMAVAEKKVAQGDVKDMIKPFYMRASEAERNKKS